MKMSIVPKDVGPLTISHLLTLCSQLPQQTMDLLSESIDWFASSRILYKWNHMVYTVFKALLRYGWHTVIFTYCSCRLQWFGGIYKSRELCNHHHPNPALEFLHPLQNITFVVNSHSPNLQLQATPEAPGNSTWFLFLGIYLFWTIHRNWMKSILSFVSGFSLAVMVFGFTHVVADGGILFFLLLSSIQLYGCSTFVYPFANW